MSFLKKLKEHDPLKKVNKIYHHVRDEAIGNFNPNRRHDEPEEQEADRILAAIKETHRFQSFAEEREGNFVKWHVDGHDYMWALSEMLDRAKDVIFILDWWLTPELYLRRPPAEHEDYRLDRVLKRKAEEGVKIYVIVYKEVTQTMTMSSWHTKHTLDDLHENITCLRHPDHIGSKDSVQYWSHHEKVVVVDNHYACIGGLDLCFGRWDTHNHPLADMHPQKLTRTLFPGQDYNNARVMDFQAVRQFTSNAISVQESPRMPWHDIHMTLTGPVVLDIVQHFVERWNEIKKRKYRKDNEIDWLSLPHNITAAPNESVAQHPLREQWHNVGRRYKNHWHKAMGDAEPLPPAPEYANPPPGATCRVQVCRSVGDWSHGVLTEHSIQNAYIQLIGEAKHFIYIENQFFISATKEGGAVVNLIGKAFVDRIVKAHKEGTKFKVIICIPEVPGFSGNIKNESSLKYIMAAQYRTINRGGDSIYECLRREGIEPLDYIRFYHLRAYDRIHAPKSYMDKMEKESGVKFHEAQVALSRVWIGPGEGNQTEVTVALPLEGSGGLAEMKDGKEKQKTITVKLPASAEEALATIQKWEKASDVIPDDDYTSDSVVQHMLHDSTPLSAEKWSGTAEEEKDAYVSELLYIHSKLMIVDDRIVIMGSANINDRSQKGDGDSEIALIVEDTDLIESRLDGRPHQAGRFAATLRRQLYREHLGLMEPQNPYELSKAPNDFMRPAPTPNPELPDDDRIVDPVSEETMGLWKSTARKNRQIFQELFHPVPSDLVRDWSAYDKYVPSVKTGHLVPEVTLERAKERLAEVRGALVECPVDFLIDQKDFAEGPEWKGLNPTLPIYV
ncbi:phospholipase D/nuclease [Cylindrobasidium torrendii FP15055 ss-10]|uniref:Phospholipase n=1 Tax=Cylindrobasidium torrendii FP15055 ss-10 TaxID=1314674 RepID=A0A0D7BLS4_9AGAR|nr:phospholipase D/nuclease [Cylindrobasidium torrendii FP15055 ss-10]